MNSKTSGHILMRCDIKIVLDYLSSLYLLIKNEKMLPLQQRNLVDTTLIMWSKLTSTVLGQTDNLCLLI